MNKISSSSPSLQDKSDLVSFLADYPDAILILGTDAHILWANCTAARRYGYSEEELATMHTRDLAAPELRDKIPEILKTSAVSPNKVKWRHKCKNGQEIPVEIYSHPVSYRGQPAILSSIRDISQQESDRKTSEENRLFLERLLDTEPGTVYVFDLPSRSNVYINKQILSQYGYTPEETRAMGKELAATLFHPDDLARIEAGHASWSETPNGTVRETEYRVRNKSGDWHWMNSRETPFAHDSRGRVTQILGIASDISERKRREDLLKTQSHALEMITCSRPLAETLHDLIASIETQCPDMLGLISVLTRDGKTLVYGAAPSLPQEYCVAISGMEIGPQAGSCGTAAYTRTTVAVEDIASDPLWSDYKDLALKHGLRACWSIPIFGAGREVLGTFAMYYREPGPPQSAHIAIVKAATDVAGMVIRCHNEDSAILDSERQLQFVTDSAPVLIAHCDKDKRYKFVNRPFAQLFGQHPASIVGKHARSVMGEQAFAHAEPYMDRALAGEKVGYDLVLPETAHGQHYVHANYLPEKNEAGQVVGFLAAITDISERVQVENRLKGNLEMLADAEAMGKVGSWCLDISTQELTWSDEVFRIHEADLAAGITLEESLAAYSSDSLPIIQSAVQKAIRFGEPFDLELEIKTFRGNKRTVHAIGRRDSDKKKLIGFFQDITERERINKELRDNAAWLRLAISASNIGLFDWDLQSNEVYYSPQWKAQIGYQDEEISNKLEEWSSRVHPNDLDDALASVQSYLENPIGTHQIDFRFQHKDGSYRWIHTNAAIVDDDSGSGRRMIGCHIDVTNQKTAEKTLEKSEQGLKQAQRLAHIGNWLYGVDGSATWSDELYRIFGQDRSRFELNTNSFIELIYPADRAAMEAWIQDTIAGKSPGKLIFRIVKPNGQLRYLLGQGTLNYDEQGNPRDIEGTTQDITDRQLSELQLRRINRYYSALSETDQAVVRATSMDKLFQQVCEIAVNSAGFKLAWIGVPDHDRLRIIASAGPDDGHLDRLLISLNPSIPQGQGPAGLAFASGKAQFCQDFVQDSITHPWRELATDLRIGSSAALPLHMDSKLTAIMGVYAEEKDLFQEEERNLLRKMATNISFGLDHLKQTRELEKAVQSLEDAKLELEERVKQRTAELEHARDQAEAGSRVKSAFLATMSHEFRTPMNSIIGFTGVVLDELAGPLTADQRKHLSIVNKAGSHLMDLINDILDISRIEAGEMAITLAPVHIPNLLQESVAMFESDARKLGLDLELKIDPAIETITTDGLRVKQVVSNLLSNALKFTDEGKVTLTAQQQEDTIRVSVTDTGIGISEADIPQLFQPFKQLMVGPKRVPKGTGLGLAISKRIVAALGGGIGVQSQKQVGSTFFFTLPFEGPKMRP